MRYVLITGANRGIGLELVKQFLKEDYIVIACSRNLEKAKSLEKLWEKNKTHLHIVKMDVGDRNSIVEAFNDVCAITKKLDILINNAGIISGIFVGRKLDTSDYWCKRPERNLR